MSTPTTNADFLSAIFGTLPEGVAPRICGFEGNPKAKDAEDDRRKWSGWPWVSGAAADYLPWNWYYTLGTFRPDAEGQYRRKKRLRVAVHGVMLDDLGTKVEAARLQALSPSFVVETSPGNYQATYLFSEPVTDLAAADALQDALIAANLCDPGAHGAGTRNCRMPFGINGKYDPPARCNLVEWSPHLRYSIAQIAQAFGLRIDSRPRHVTVHAARTGLWDSRPPAVQESIVRQLRDALSTIPSDNRKLWIAVAYALRTLPDELGLPLFLEWSAKSWKFDDEYAVEVYFGCEPDDTAYPAIFNVAAANGWVNPGPDPRAWFSAPVTLPAGASPTPIPHEIATSHASTAVRLVRGDAVEMKPVQWLWPGFLPAAMLSIIGGAPGCGKTTIALSLAATITKGGSWPDGTSCSAPGDVLVWSGEDPQSVLAARLTAMGANLSRVYFIDGVGEGEAARAFDPGRDMAQLEQQARALPAPRMLIVDPIVSAVAGDAHKSNEVRRALQPVVDLGQRLGCAVIGITHFTKGTAGRDPVERVTGSIAFAALARLVMVAARVKGEGGERRVFVRAKSNIGPDDGGFVYTLERVPVQFAIEGQLVRWIEPLQGSASEALAEAERTDEREEDGTKAEIRDFVRQVIASREGKPIPSIDFEHEATTAGLKWAKVRAGLPRMGITRRKTPGTKTGGWYWEISNQAEWDKNASP